MPAERISEYAPHRCPVRCRDDAHCGGSARTKDAPELQETPRRVREELEPELADDGVKRAIPERPGLTVGSHHRKRPISEPTASRPQHRWTDVRTNDKSRRFDDRCRDECGFAWSHGDIEHSASATHLSGG